MAKAPWEFEPKRDWPAKVKRNWLWTMMGEKASHAKVVATAVETGATDVIALVNDTPSVQPTFKVRMPRAHHVELSKMLADVGVDYHISTWIDPTASYVQAAADGMADLSNACNAKTLCLDLEGEWRKRISNHTEFVSTVLAPAFQGYPTPIGITSFSALPKSVVPALAWSLKYHKGYGMPQAYSVYQGKSWQNSALIRPDRMPFQAWDTWSPVAGSRLVCLLAAYGNPVPGRAVSGSSWTGGAFGVGESIEVAVSAAVAAGFQGVGWWSEEALSKKSGSAADRREAIGEMRVSGKDYLYPSLAARLVVPGLVVAGLGGIALALRRGR